MTITVRNGFHNTEVRVQVAELPAVLSRSQTTRVLRELCPVTDCQCGSVYGPQHGPDGERLRVYYDWQNMPNPMAEVLSIYVVD